MPPLSVMIKPVSGACNMNCRYCFYMDEMAHRPAETTPVMSEDMLETLVAKAFAYAQTRCSFAFQGGEPTLRGLDFYRKLLEFVKRYNTQNLPVSYSIQTNGYAVNEEWASFLAQNGFLVGLSVDGFKEVHNYLRMDKQGDGTFSAVLRAARCLDKAGAEYNILTVVTAQLARHVDKVFAFYKKNGWTYQQYIACLDPLFSPRGQKPYSLTPELYASFLCRLFDLWFADVSQGKQLYIRYFDALICQIKGVPVNCDVIGKCANQMVIEADGSVYPCDFYVLDEYKIGNIGQQDFFEIAKAGENCRFVKQSEGTNAGCHDCRWLPVCHGGCRRDREQGRNYYCQAYSSFLDYAWQRLCWLADRIP